MTAWIARLFAIAAMAVVLAASPSLTPPAQAADQAEVEAAVRKLLTEKPEIVIDAIRAYQAREEAAQEEEQRLQLSAQKGAIMGNPGDPVIGNPDGAVTVVEFFDYRCGYCKRSLQTVLDLVERNPDVRVVFKEFPILGEDSVTAAKVSLAVHLAAPQHYRAFHEKAMRHRGAMSEDALLTLAVDAGADRDAVAAAMDNPIIQATITANYELAQALGIRGTPAFVVGEKVVPGAVNLPTLEQLVAKERG